MRSNSGAIWLIKDLFHRSLWCTSIHFYPLTDLESDTHPARPVLSSFIFHPLILAESDTHPETNISFPSNYPLLCFHTNSITFISPIILIHIHIYFYLYKNLFSLFSGCRPRIHHLSICGLPPPPTTYLSQYFSKHITHYKFYIMPPHVAL